MRRSINDIRLAALVALAGGGAGWLVATRLWAWIALDGQLVRAGLSRHAIAGALAGALAGLLAGVAVAACRQGPRAAQGPAPRRLPLAAVSALLLLAAAEAVMRQPNAQSALWLATRSRCRPGFGDFFAKELAYLQLEVSGERGPSDRPALLIVGSSQLLHGLDCDVIKDALPGLAVKRRSLAGMTPLKACMAQRYLSLGPGCVLLMYLSELDFSDAHVNPDWLRPVLSPAGLRDGWAALDDAERRRSRADVPDLLAASRSALWRTRDYLRHLVLHLAGPEEAGEATDLQALAAQQMTRWRDEQAMARSVAMHRRALARLTERVRAQGGRIIVFEGQSNPRYYTPERTALRERVRTELRDWARASGQVYVPVSEQDLDIGPADWRDSSHLNDEGRRKLTAMIAARLRLALAPPAGG